MVLVICRLLQVLYSDGSFVGNAKLGFECSQRQGMDLFLSRQECLLLCNSAPHSVLMIKICKFHRVIGFLV